jgi:hypothetical protein
MAIRQSIIDLYGEVSVGLQRINGSADPATKRVRQLGIELTGLTGSAGERGWHGELVRYFDAHSTGSEPVQPNGLGGILGEISDDGLLLDPSWSYHAIVAGYLMQQLTRVGAVEPLTPEDEPDLLAYALAASPAQTPGMVEQARVELDMGRELADVLRSNDDIVDKATFLNALAGMAQLSSAVKPKEMESRLRKVKQEYCSVVSTDITWDTMSYTKLKNSIAPANWERYYEEFFCDMDVDPALDPYGWTRIRESVSGDCARYRLRTALRFWTASNNNGLYLNYDMDAEPNSDVDSLVLVDNGYIWITPITPTDPDAGVRVRTSKQLLISGMSATALTKLAETLGYASSARDMFLKAAAFTPKMGSPPLQPWSDSHVVGDAKPDTSTTWPVKIPQLPPSIRDEMCRDTTTFLKDRLDDINGIAQRFGDRWEDGIDVPEIKQTATELGDEVTKAIDEGFELATSNFRPKPTNP